MHAESHQKDLTWRPLEDGAWLRWLPSDDVFVAGLSDYSCIPEEVILTSEDMKTCEELSRKRSVRKMSSEGLRCPWEGSCQSAVHTLSCLFLC